MIQFSLSASAGGWVCFWPTKRPTRYTTDRSGTRVRPSGPAAASTWPPCSPPRPPTSAAAPTWHGWSSRSRRAKPTPTSRTPCTTWPRPTLTCSFAPGTLATTRSLTRLPPHLPRYGLAWSAWEWLNTSFFYSQKNLPGVVFDFWNEGWLSVGGFSVVLGMHCFCSASMYYCVQQVSSYTWWCCVQSVLLPEGVEL